MINSLLTFDKKLFIDIYTFFSDSTRKFFKILCILSKPFYYIVYFILLFYIFSYLADDYILAICIIKPLIAIIVSKTIRKIINRRRPYLAFSYLSLPQKNEPSFPSNHTCSAFIISYMFFYVSYEIAIILLIIATISSVSRIIIGIHFPLDILGGIALSTLIFLL